MMESPCEHQKEDDPVTNSNSKLDDTTPTDTSVANKEAAEAVDNNNKTKPASAPVEGSPSLSSISTVPPASPPPSPLQSFSSEDLSPPPNNNTAAVTSTSNSVRSPVRSTPQMMVLGKDGSDYRDLLLSSASKRSAKHTNNNSNMERQQALLNEEENREAFVDEAGDRTRSWWKNLWHGKRRSTDNDGNGDDGNGDNYTSMEEATGEGVARRPQQQNSDVEAPSVYYHTISAESTTGDSLQSPPRPLSLGNMHKSLLRNLPLPATKEDQILQDCSFLYRAVDEERSPPRNTTSTNNNNNGKRRGMRAIVDLPPDGVATLYRDAQDVLSPPAVAQYRAKYHQLNQVYAPRNVDRFENYNDNDCSITQQRLPTAVHELTLEEQQQEQPGNPEQQQQQQQHSLVTNVTTQSSLFFQQHGRVVLRLPRDHVHLLVASPNDNTAHIMEPGILSVIQCRGPNDPPTKQLEYCLTVQPNLYQRVVSEITQYASHSHGGGGLDSSFYASDHADIRIAIGIMTVISIVLGICVLVYGLD